MHEVHAILERKVSWPLLVQGSAPRTALLREFRATPNAVLLATSSFWQGVDAAGEALSSVIIDRLPFASPGDPDRRAHERHRSAGRPSVRRLSGAARHADAAAGARPADPHAHRRGLLAVLDPRLVRKAYGRRFLASLPPAPLTNDLGDVEAFFGRI
jgi:ATP-dependent DNA helicase DinG